MEQSKIRNFSIIAHIDHGKSTLADRILEQTEAVAKRDMEDQILDNMDLERERGITIKAHAVTLVYRANDGEAYTFNLIDTPGHVDFNYEVSRSLAACEGAVLVVDASQGIEAQTLANTYLAVDAGLEVVPVLNKIDLISADPDKVAAEIEDVIGIPAEDAPRISAKTGLNIKAVMEKIVTDIPAPQGDPDMPLRALIFDSYYDAYRGVIAYVRIKEGTVHPGDTIRMMAVGSEFTVVECGILRATSLEPAKSLSAGEVGYITASIKNVREARVGDTITLADRPAAEPLPGYRAVQPMVFCGVYPADGAHYADLRDALEKLQLNDAALTFEELTEWLEKENVRLEKKVDSNPESLARIFPTVAGILRTMKDRDPEYEYVAVDGIENCIAALEDVAAGHVNNCFMEMSACKGSCVNGPVMEKYHPWFITDYLSVTRYAGDKDFPVEQPEISELSRRYDILEGMKDMPTERKIQEILSKMGKKKPSDELNCGTCGYDTCREKAIAIYQGKAEIEMCLPYLKEKAENFSNIIFDNTPNGLLVLNERLEIQQINPAACRIMNIRRPSDVLGSQIVTLLDPKPFLDALESRKSVFQCAYLAEYDRYVEEQVLYDQSYRMLFCMLEDVSDEAAEREKKAEMRRQTTEVADKVVEKQMRIVQEIASLLGETAAETKIALTNLKESMKDE